MGKASSNKKVARAAGIGGGRTNRSRTPWTYYGAILLVLVLGVAGTWVSRNQHLHKVSAAGTGAPTVGVNPPWYEAYGVYECGRFVPAIKTVSHSKSGIETTIKGIIKIQPTAKAYAGKNATLGVFASTMGMKLNAAEVQVPGGHLYQDGDTCQGKTGELFVKTFPDYTDTVGTISTQDPRSILLASGTMVTIAFVPKADKSKIPPPPSYAIDALKKQLSATTTTTSSTTSTTTSAASKGTGLSGGSTTTTTTTKSSGSTTTTTPSSTTTTTTAKK